jgi:hypothetical protein
MARPLILYLATAFSLSACAAQHQGYLLKTATGQKSAVIFRDNPQGHDGKVEATMANGEQCLGQFNTIPDQVTTKWNTNNEVDHEDTQLGVAVLKCADHHIVRCDFSRALEGSGSGNCIDNQGQKYSLNLE